MERTYYIASWNQDENEGVSRIVYDKENDRILSCTLLDYIKRSSYFARTEDHLFVLTEAPIASPDSGCITSLHIVDDKPVVTDKMEHIASGITHLSFSRNRKHLYLSGYGTGSIYIVDVDPFGYLSNFRTGYIASGSSINKKRQESPHIHFSQQTPDGEYLCACDLGTDEVLVFMTDPHSGNITLISTLKTPLGYGPRHMTFSKDGRYAYVLCELTYHLLIYAYEGTGNLEFIKDIDLYPEAPADQRQCSAIKINKEGTLLYTINRGQETNCLDIYDLTDGEDPKLICRSQDVYFSRDLTLLDDGYVAVCNQPGDNVQFLKYENGELKETGRFPIKTPVSLVEW